MSKKILLIAAVIVAILTVTGSAAWAGSSGRSDPEQEASYQTQPAKPFMGVKLANITSALADRLDLSQDQGVVIIQVLADSPAEEAGLQTKDIVLKLGAVEVATVNDVIDAVAQYQVGDSVTLMILRGDDETEVAVTLGEKPSRLIPQLRGKLWLGLEELPLPDIQGWLDDLQPKIAAPSELFDRFLGGELRYLDKDGNPVTKEIIPGTVDSVSGNMLTIITNEDASQTFDVSEDAIIKKGLSSLELDELEVGDKVVITLVNGEVKAIVVNCGVAIGRFAPRFRIELPPMPPGFGDRWDDLPQFFDQFRERLREHLSE